MDKNAILLLNLFLIISQGIKKTAPAVNTDSERPQGDVEQTLGNTSKNYCSSSCFSNRYFWLWMNSETFWDSRLNNRLWLLFTELQILLQKHSVLTLYLQVNTKLFVIITLQLSVSPCLALIAEGNQGACFIMPINWVNWLILISCFLNLMRDSASLGKHIILQQDQKQRKPDNKSLGFHRMFTGKLSVFWPELGLKTGFESLQIPVLTLQTQENQLFWKEVAFSWVETPCALWEKIKKLRSPKIKRRNQRNKLKELLSIKI